MRAQSGLHIAGYALPVWLLHPFDSEGFPGDVDDEFFAPVAAAFPAGRWGTPPR